MGGSGSVGAGNCRLSGVPLRQMSATRVQDTGLVSSFSVADPMRTRAPCRLTAANSCGFSFMPEMRSFAVRATQTAGSERIPVRL